MRFAARQLGGTEMPYLQWEDRFDLGVSQMDQEHRGLFALMNKLFDLNEKKAGRALVRAALLELEQRTIEHFKHEEAYQQSIEFPGFSIHRRVHQNLLERLDGYKQEFMSGNDLTPDFFTFLKLWLSGHIAGVDQKYAKHATKAA
jgi:hemerythrin-like metal-binding protein